MNQYITGEATTFNSPRSRGKVNITVIGGITMPVQCLILKDHDECAVVVLRSSPGISDAVLDDWESLRGKLHSPAGPYEDWRAVDRIPPSDGITTKYSPAVGKYEAGVVISVVAGGKDVSVYLRVRDVKRLIQRLQRKLLDCSAVLQPPTI